jgi:hypothetical protein
MTTLFALQVSRPAITGLQLSGHPGLSMRHRNLSQQEAQIMNKMGSDVGTQYAARQALSLQKKGATIALTLTFSKMGVPSTQQILD